MADIKRRETLSYIIDIFTYIFMSTYLLIIAKN